MANRFSIPTVFTHVKRLIFTIVNSLFIYSYLLHWSETSSSAILLVYKEDIMSVNMKHRSYIHIKIMFPIKFIGWLVNVIPMKIILLFFFLVSFYLGDSSYNDTTSRNRASTEVFCFILKYYYCCYY